MKAIVMKDYGDSGVFEERNVDVPALNKHQVLVEIYATTAGSADQLVRSGAFREQLPLRFPHILGVEFAGVAAAIGSAVTQIKAGDRVMGLIRSGGGYAEYAAVEEGALAVIPPAIPFVQAAALPASGLTAWQALFQYGKLQAGQRILIHAGAGGVGHLAVQLAKQHGAYVITTARKDNHEFVRQLGADEIIDYTARDFAEALSPADIVLDMVRDPIMDQKTGISRTELKNYAILKDGGTLISLVNPLIARQEKVRGIEARFAFIEPNPYDLAALLQCVREQKLQVHIDKVFPFSAQGVAEGHLHFDTKPKRGKTVIQRKE